MVEERVDNIDSNSFNEYSLHEILELFNKSNEDPNDICAKSLKQITQSEQIDTIHGRSVSINHCRKKRSICAAQNVITAIEMFGRNDFEKKVFSKKLKVCSTAF